MDLEKGKGVSEGGKREDGAGDGRGLGNKEDNNLLCTSRIREWSIGKKDRGEMGGVNEKPGGLKGRDWRTKGKTKGREPFAKTEIRMNCSTLK